MPELRIAPYLDRGGGGGGDKDLSPYHDPQGIGTNREGLDRPRRRNVGARVDVADN